MIRKRNLVPLLIALLMAISSQAQEGWHVNSLGCLRMENCSGRMALSGDYVYNVTLDSSLIVVDVSNPANPSLVGTCYFTGCAWDVAVSGSFAYVAAGWGGFYVINISNPAAPTVAGHLNTPLMAHGVDVSGSYAYVADQEFMSYPNFLEVIDISDPTHPQMTGQVGVWGFVSELVAAPPYVYVGDYPEGFHVVDVSNPQAPVEVASCFAEGQAWDLALSGHYLCLADGGSGLRIYDVSTPTAPLEVGQVNVPTVAQGVSVVGRYACLACWDGGMWVVNISNPTTPLAIASYFDVLACGVNASTSYIYLATTSRFDVLQLSLPDLSFGLSPIVPYYTIPESGGSFDFNAGCYNNISQPQTTDFWTNVQLPNGNWLHQPILGPARITMPGETSLTRTRTQIVPGSAPQGYYTYRGYIGDYPIPQDSAGFLFWKTSTADSGPQLADNWICNGEPFPESSFPFQPSALNLIKIRPNPFNPTTVASFELRVPSHVSLKVYDTAGRLVATLVDGWREAGTHEVTFDGSKLASGIYLAKLEAGEFTAVQKLVLMK